MNNVYHADSFIIRRFADHFILGLKTDIGDRTEYPKNFLEKIGDAGLWFVEDFPRHVWKGMKDPRVVTLAVTALALLGASFAFYPFMTLGVVKAGIALIPVPPFWAIKFSAYVFTVGTILSAAARAQGRFFNSSLMEAFYGTAKKAEEPAKKDEEEAAAVEENQKLTEQTPKVEAAKKDGE